MNASPPPELETSVVWSDARLLGYAPMDETHREFYQVVFKLLTCDEGHALPALERFEQHAVAHFAEEEHWMRTTDFPRSECHVDEHAAVLRSTREVREALLAGRAGAELAHRLAQHLFDWFPGHADYLDSALATWMAKRAYGGKPIVLRRQA